MLLHSLSLAETRPPRARPRGHLRPLRRPRRRLPRRRHPASSRDLDHAERIAFLDFAAAIADASWPEASLYFQRGPDLLRGVEPGQRAHYLDSQHPRRPPHRPPGLRPLRRGRHRPARRRRRLPRPPHRAGRPASSRLSPVAAMSFLKSAPTLTERLRLDELEAWHDAGLEILRDSVEGGEAYFRLESGKAEQMIQQLSARVDLDRVSRAAAPLLQGAHRHQHQRAARRRPRREGHRLGQRARPLHRRHLGLPARVHRGVRQQGGELRRLQGLRHPPGRAPRVRQLRLQLRAATAPSATAAATSVERERRAPRA